MCVVGKEQTCILFIVKRIFNIYIFLAMIVKDSLSLSLSLKLTKSCSFFSCGYVLLIGVFIVSLYLTTYFILNMLVNEGLVCKELTVVRI